jgi:arylsulfatase A-like enzyme
MKLRFSLFFFVGFLAPVIGVTAETPQRPNIVIIFTDDQGYGDLGSYGLTTAKTPHLDRMAEEGTRFTSFYTQPVCGPARSALLTGRYPERSKGWQMPAHEITFAELMQEAGYATACVGKWDVSHRKRILDRMPLAQGFDYYWGPLGANDGGRVVLYENNELIGPDTDLASITRRYTDKSIEWMTGQVETNREREPSTRKPFLLYLCHTMMHTVIDASPEFRDHTGNGLYADTLEELDHECGRLLQAIDDLGIAEDTLVVFTSDNGAWSNDAERQNPKNAAHIEWTKGKQTAVGTNAPLREGKASDYEGGVRVPCLVKWPSRVPAGRVNDAIFATLDFLPTFANLAGFEVPTDRVIDGVNQIDLLTGESETGNRDTYFYHSGTHGVRKGPWKFLKADRWSETEMERRTYPKDFGTNEIELYHLDEDIGETTNLAEKHPEIVAELQSLTLPPEKKSFARPPAKPAVAKENPKAKAKGKGQAKAKGQPKARQRVHSPNIVFFMVDDLGIGDVQCYNPDSTVPTPHIDALAKAGTRFTDAHSPSAVCSPTRYSVLTGRYPWRDGVGGALQGIHDPTLQRNQPVLAKFLRRYGYRTAMFGKWHIGLRFAGDYTITKPGLIEGEPDFHQPLVDGPTHHGFDVFFGVNGNFDLAQHLDFWIENDRVVAPGSLVKKTEKHPRRGIVLDAWRAKDWDPRDLTRLPMEKALAFLDDHHANHPDKPFYLHFTPNAIHKDFFPNATLNGKPVQGRGGTLGPRGELIVETDLMLGAFVDKLKELGIFEDTLVVFTSDNGGQGATEALEVGHRVNGPWAGCKGMILEGGHRVPYILSYPAGGVEAGAVNDTKLGLVDWFPSVATYVAGPEDVAKLRPFDGADRSALFEGKNPEPRGHALIHSGSNRPIGQIGPHPIMDEPRFAGFAVREDDWKLIVKGNEGKPHALYDLGTDPGETTNLLEQHPERVQRMRERFVETRDAVDSLAPRKRAEVPKEPAAKQASSNPVRSSTQPSSKTRPAPEGAPDILFVAIDDLNTWSKLYDPAFPIEMPNLERLAARGAFFSRAYCAAPACAPSRAAVMSGQRPSTSGLYNNPNQLEDHHADTVFLPQWFQRHGYRTWGVGKILHGEPATIGDPPRPIFESFTRKNVIFPPDKLHGPTKGAGHQLVYDWGEMERPLSDDRTLDLAIARMKEIREAEAPPEFQAVGIFSPHLPHYARPEHFARYPVDSLVLPPMPVDDFDDIPAAGRAFADFQKSWNQDLLNAHAAGDPEPLRTLVRSYQAAASYADEMIGRLLDGLDATGRADDTVIVLWSDHGYHLGDKESVVKFTLWEMACRVPLVIVAPGVTEPGTRIDTPVDLVDLYPTLVELAGLPSNPGLDGESLVPLLKNPGAGRETPAITTFLEGNHAIATTDWRYLRYADGSEELYRAEDVWNHENVAGDVEHAEVLPTLRKWLPGFAAE